MTGTSRPAAASRSRSVAGLAAGALAMALLGPVPAGADETCLPALFLDRMDIPEEHRDNVDCAVAEGIVEGYEDRTYRPALTVPRDQMASVVARALDAAGVDLPAARDQGFRDIDDNVHADNINRLAEAGIAEGFADRTFRPAQPVLRDQLASFLLRALAHAHGRHVAELQGGQTPFTDIDGNPHRPNIEGAYRADLARGRTATRYAPRDGVRRDQTASFAVRALEAFRGEEDSGSDEAGVSALPQPDVPRAPDDTAEPAEPGGHERSDHVVEGAGGTPIAVSVYRPAGASGEQPAPVILHSHGWAGSRTRDGGAFAAELDRGFGVVSIDQRGHGDSGGRIHIMDPEREGRDNIAVVDFLASLDWVAKDVDGAGQPIPDDPVLFAMGGSYGGGYQLITALTETRANGRTRLNAVAPEITWFSLPQSLAPQKVVRSGWAAALYLLGAPRLADHIHRAFAWGVASGQWPDESAPEGVPDLDAELLRHSPAGFVGQDVRLDVPALVGQGITDNLFNLNEGWHNFEQTLTEAARAQSVFVGYNGGHAVPSALPPGHPLDSGLDTAVDACSPEGGFAELRLAFFESVRAGRNPRGLTGSAYSLTTADGECVQVDRLDDYTTTPADELLTVGTATLTGVGLPQHVELAKGPLTVAGVPRLTTTVTAIGVDQRAFFALSVGRSPLDARIVQDNMMPLREAAPVTGQERSIELPGVAVDVPEGHTLYLTVSPVSDVSFGHGSIRTPGVMAFDDLRVDLPLVR